jgi:hypothetical protein
MKSSLKKVYSKLSTKVSLNEQKKISLNKVVELRNLIDETDNLLSKFINDYDEAMETIKLLEDKLSNIKYNFENAVQRSTEKLDELQTVAKELGVNVGQEEQYQLSEIIDSANDEFNLARQTFNF